jgi:hypothetical protein
MLSIWWVAIVILLIFAAHTQFRFLAYCRETAIFEGREQELLSKEGVDDVGTSQFERDEFHKIMALQYPLDEKLAYKGRTIRICWLIQVVGMVAIIGWGVWTDTRGCM